MMNLRPSPNWLLAVLIGTMVGRYMRSHGFTGAQLIRVYLAMALLFYSIPDGFPLVGGNA